MKILLWLKFICEDDPKLHYIDEKNKNNKKKNKKQKYTVFLPGCLVRKSAQQGSASLRNALTTFCCTTRTVQYLLD